MGRCLRTAPLAVGRSINREISISRRGLPGSSSLGAGTRIEHRAARPRELWRVLSQARRDPIGIRHLGATQPEYVGRAGHLLLQRSTVVVRKSGSLSSDAEGDGYRNAQENSVRSHIPSFLFWEPVGAHVPWDKRAP